MANRYLQRCSTSLITLGKQTKTTMGHHFTSVRMANIKRNFKKISVGKDLEKLELLYTAAGNGEWCNHH